VPRTARLPLLLLLLLCALLAGCGLLPGDADGTPRERFRAAVDDLRRAVEEEVRRAVEEAQQQAPQEEGDLPSGGDRRRAPSVDAIRTDTNTRFDYDEYVSTLEQVLASLEQYWETALPEAFGVAYSPPSRYVYYRSDEGEGPRCGGQAAPAKNAFYCPAGDFIGWDETGLMIPYYVSAGDFAAAFVLAHEFGHAMQARLPEQERLTILSELQADCFAGAWSRSVSDQGLLEAGDLDEATFAVFSARDVPGTPFTDPAAHGSGFERTRAFSDGYEDGPKACFPAPEDDWLVRS
jgi:uncharacterized protein